jgi:hypothetical protein
MISVGGCGMSAGGSLDSHGTQAPSMIVTLPGSV